MLFQELLALSVSKAEEDYIDFIEWHLARKLQVGFANQSFMHVRHKIASIALRVRKHDFYLRVIEKNTNQFSSRISCST